MASCKTLVNDEGKGVIISVRECFGRTGKRSSEERERNHIGRQNDLAVEV